PHSRFKFHLEVASGKPVNPLSPTRAGGIEDSAYHELLAFVKDQVFAFIANTQIAAASPPPSSKNASASTRNAPRQPFPISPQGRSFRLTTHHRSTTASKSANSNSLPTTKHHCYWNRK